MDRQFPSSQNLQLCGNICEQIQSTVIEAPMEVCRRSEEVHRKDDKEGFTEVVTSH